MKSFGLSETKLFYFHWIFKKKRDKISTPTRTFIHMNPLSRNPGSVTVVLVACSHVYLLACMQQCACLSGGARSMFCLGFRLPLFFVRARTKQWVRGVCECPDYCVCAHARLSCRCSHISWHACITNSSGEFVISFEH